MLIAGWGVVVPVLPVVLVIAARSSIDSTFGAGYSADHRWPTALALVIAGVLTFVLGQTLLLDREGDVVEGAAGEEQVVERRDAFLWLPIRVWGGVFFLAAVAYLLWP